jgi:hypothetical protein
MKNKQKYTPVRFSHLTSYAGVGAVVRGAEDMLMAIADIRYWTDKNGHISSDIIPYVRRVSMALAIDKELRMPPHAQENDKGGIDGNYLPAVLFPVYAKCQKCGLLHNNPWKKQDKKITESALCEQCNSLLEQTTWCAVSNKGYMSEVPWHLICHQDSEINCKADYSSSYLVLRTNINGKRIVECNRCKSSKPYENTKTKYINGIQPWIYERSPKLDEDDIVEILEVNNPGVYLPERANALVIPPESRMGQTSIIDRLYNNSKFRRELDNIKIPLRKKGKLKEAATEYRCSVIEIKEALEEIKSGYPYFEENITIGELIEDEYKAFLEPIEDVADDEDFVTSHKTKELHSLNTPELAEGLSSIINMIDNHIVATRLREIQVFKGFKRSNNGDLVPPDIIGSSTWLPAIELFGEGVFFSINEQIVSNWENIPAVRKRADEILKRYETSEVEVHNEPTITARFILLHTISHLLIRELESTAGYPAASLKERVYCSIDRKMAGILIYTSVADIVGSLGGIVESAEPKEFLKLMDGVFKHAQWCSLDPICTEHEGQGPGWLNRAACHACSLVPEPSCDYNNVFLDRVFVKGSKELKIPNFLDFVANESNHKKVN